MALDDNEIIRHHGIMGMRWGVRRYQNADGSLTPAGRKKAKKLRSQYKDLTRKPLKKADAEKKADAKEKEDALKRKRVKDLSDGELNNRIRRLQNEKTALSLERDLSSKGSKFVSSVSKNVLVPSTIDAGRNVLTRVLTNKLSDAAGLNKQQRSQVDSAFNELKRSTEVAELKTRKYKAQSELKNAKLREQNAKQKAQTEDYVPKHTSSGKEYYNNLKETTVNDSAYNRNSDNGENFLDMQWRRNNK